MKVQVKCPWSFAVAVPVGYGGKTEKDCGGTKEFEIRQEEVESGDWSRQCPRCGAKLTKLDAAPMAGQEGER